jgi:hypothetical protein
MTPSASGDRSSSLRAARSIGAVCTMLGRSLRIRSAQRLTPATQCQYLCDLRRDRKSQSKGCLVPNPDVPRPDAHALHCWRANGHVILHRVAKIQLAATEEHRRKLRRTWVLTRLRKLVWQAAWMEVDYDNDVILERFVKWTLACFRVGRLWREAERIANHWRLFLL